MPVLIDRQLQIGRRSTGYSVLHEWKDHIRRPYSWGRRDKGAGDSTNPISISTHDKHLVRCKIGNWGQTGYEVGSTNLLSL